MPFPVSIIGRSTAPVHSKIDGAWLTAFASAVGSPAASHPLFPVCVEWPAVTAAARLDDGALASDERRRGIHATHDLTIHRLIRAGDVVSTTATVDALEARRRGTFQRVRLETRAADGTLVATTLMGSMFIGVAIDGDLTASAAKGDAVPVRDEEDRPETVETVAITVAGDQARAYSEASHIWNPIHTDDAAAIAAGLAAPILHGTCTLGLATSAALAWAGVDVRAVRRIRVRFVGMVAMPSTLALHVWHARNGGAGDELGFEVVDSNQQPVLADGRLTL